MMNKTWNVRDQTEHELRFKIEKLYTNIEAKYKLLKKVSQKIIVTGKQIGRAHV